VVGTWTIKGAAACARIAYTGVCGKCAKSGKTIIVPNVHEFPGHIMCDPRAKSEIAVPVLTRKAVLWLFLTLAARNMVFSTRRIRSA